MIPYGKQDISIEDINSVLETLKSEFITQGPKVEKFEKKIIDEVGCNYSVTANSATSCLHLACKALELKRMIGCGPAQTVLWQVLMPHYTAAQKLILLI